MHSGVVEVQMDFKEENERICSATTQCTIRLLVPLNSGVDLAGKSLACVHLAPEYQSQDFTATILQTGLEIQGGTHVACEVTRLGRFMVRVCPHVCGPHLAWWLNGLTGGRCSKIVPMLLKVQSA